MARRWRFAGNGNRSALHRVLDKRVSICFCAMQGEKQSSLLYFSRIAGNLENFQIARGGRHSHLCALEQFRQFSANGSVVVGRQIQWSVNLARGGVP